MKLTQVLCKQNIQKQFVELWWRKRHQIVHKTNAEAIAEKMGVKIVEAVDYLNPPKQFQRAELDHLEPLIHFDERHPDWKDRACLTYNDTNVLIEGVNQAQVITNTVKIADELPGRYQDLMKATPIDIDHLVQNIIKTATMYNAHQEKLPKIKDPARPAWVFPRAYGLTVHRKVKGMSHEFIRLCDMLYDTEVAEHRIPVQDVDTSLFIEKEGSLLNFELSADIMVMSSYPISPIMKIEQEMEVPVLDPLHFTIGLGKMNIYKQEDMYPIKPKSTKWCIHTVFAFNDPEVVKNLSELPVTETQIHGRSLMKAFTMAAFNAREKYGSCVSDLPEPITVQCIQTNGQDFHFSVFQLNTLDLRTKSSMKNYWWSSQTMKLFQTAAYVKGIPTLEGYNPDVFRTLFAFYANQ